MKKTNYFILIVVFIFASCSSNEGIGTAIDENLPEIAQKLESFETSVLEIEDESSSFKTSNKKRKSLNKNLESCEYGYTDQFSDSELTHNIVYKYFDNKGKPITDCELWQMDETSAKYAIDVTSTITGNNINHTTHQYSSYESSIKLLSTSSIEYSQTIYSDIDGVLNFNGDIFNILDGSYIDIEISFEFSENSNPEQLFEEIYPEIDLKYIVGFEVNGNNYHFDMLLDTEGFKEIQENDNADFSTKYNLLNSQNKKIGTVVYNYNNGQETFDVLDLDGNIVSLD